MSGRERPPSPANSLYTEPVREQVLLFGGAVLGDPSGGRRLPADRRGCLLAYLAADGGWVERNRLALLFWPESDEHGAKRNLRQLLLRTKRLDLARQLEARVDAVRWPVESDVAQFRRAVAVGDHARATALYRGPLLDGHPLEEVAAMGAWVEAERERLHAAFHAAALRHAAALAGRDQPEDALRLLERLAGYDEFAEDVVVAQLRLLAGQGRRDAATTLYERFAAALAEGLGLEPLATTTALIDSIRAGATPPALRHEEPRSQPLPAPLRTPHLVGRDAERAALRAADAPLVAVAGAPGAGKTRLLREAFPDATYSGAREGLERVPYHPLARLIRLHLQEARGLGALAEDLARLVPEVVPEVSPAPLGADAARSRLLEALARFVQAMRAPLVVDDLQWADPATLEALAYLATRRVRVVVGYRSAEAPPHLERFLAGFAARGELSRLALADLGEDDVRALLADLMGRASGPPTFARWLWRRSGGNPMFLLETLKALFESGALWEAGGDWHTEVDQLTHDYSELDVPPVVSEVILRRLAYLPPAAQRVVKAVAVTGSANDVAFLATATGLAPPDVADALDEAERAGFLAAREFQHDLLRQALYESVEPHRKRLLHALAGDHLEAAGLPEVAAEHLWAAGQYERARLAWSRQVWHLRSSGLLVEASEVLQRATARLPAGADRAWLRLQLVDVVREAGRLEDARRELLKVTLPDDCPPALRLRLVQTEVTLLLQAGSVAEADALLKANRALATLVEDEEQRATHALLLAHVARESQRPEEAIHLLTPVVARLRQARPDVRLVQHLTSLGVLHDDIGRFAEGLELHSEAFELAKALGSRYYQVEAATNLVVCLQSLGRFQDAAPLGEEMLRVGTYDNVPTLRLNLAYGYFEDGRVSDALRHYRELTRREEPHLRLIALARSAECLALVGSEAERQFEVARLIDAALAELASADYPAAIGRAMIATLKHGSPEQRDRLMGMSLDRSHIPDYLRTELTELLPGPE